MRRPFYRQIRANRLRLALFLLVFLAAAVVAGYLVGLVAEPILAPGAWEERFQYQIYVPWHPALERTEYLGAFPYDAVGLVTGIFLLAAVGYCGWMLRRGGGAILALTGARRLHEARLRNTADEMGIAAGFDRPVRVWVVEDDSMNAFACRDPAGRGAVVATRGLLERLDRDEIQAVMAHETSHLANGDTRLMTLLFGVSRALDAVLWIGFFSARFLAWIVGRAREMEDEEDVGPSGGAEATPPGPMSEIRPNPWIETERVRRLRQEIEERSWIAQGFFVLGLLVTAAAFALVVVGLPLGFLLGVHWRYSALLVGLPLALLLLRMAISRNREFQADATAVSLSRNPEGLRSALQAIGADRAPASELRPSVAHLCIAPPGFRGRPGDGLRSLERSLREDGAILPPDARAAVLRAAGSASPAKRPVALLYAWVMTGLPVAGALAAARRIAGLWETHPPLEERIARLGAMGAGD